MIQGWQVDKVSCSQTLSTFKPVDLLKETRQLRCFLLFNLFIDSRCIKAGENLFTEYKEYYGLRNSGSGNGEQNPVANNCSGFEE